MFKIYKKAQKHDVFSPFSASCYPPLHHNGKGSIEHVLTASSSGASVVYHRGVMEILFLMLSLQRSSILETWPGVRVGVASSTKQRLSSPIVRFLGDGSGGCEVWE